MAITPLPALDRTSATFKTDADTFFGSQLPTFSAEAEAARVAINAAAVTAEAARVTAQAAIDAGLANAAANASTATTKAGEANTSAAAAAASAASIAGGPVASVNGMSGVVTGVATQSGAETLTNKTLTGYTETVYALAGTDIAVANGSIQTKTLAANTTFTESLADGQSVILGITAGAYSVTWPSVTWAKVGGSGVAPTLTSTGVNWIILWQVGGIVRGSFMGTA